MVTIRPKMVITHRMRGVCTTEARADIPVRGAADVAFEDGTQARVVWADVRALPAREGACEIIEAGSAEEAAALLVDKLIEEKVV